MKTSDFTSGKFTNDFNKDQRVTVDKITNYLAKIGIRKSTCDEGITECSDCSDRWFGEEGDSDEVNCTTCNDNIEVPNEQFTLEFELVNNLKYWFYIGYDGTVVNSRIFDANIDDLISIQW